MAGVMGAMACAEYHKGAQDVSANYYIGNGGEIVLGVDESRRAWTSSNRDNDYQAVTIEVSNSIAKDPWTVSDKAYKALIELCVDICRRNGIKQLTWTGDSTGTLTCHYMFAATACPGTYLKNKMPDIARTVNARLRSYTLTDAPQTYTVAPGDTWLTVAKKYGIEGVRGANALIAYNGYKTYGDDSPLAKKRIERAIIRIPAKWVYGDIDGDGKVTAKDARTALRASAKLASLTPWEAFKGDIDGDGKIGAKDARNILRKSAKM